MTTSFPQQTAASHRARALHPDGKARMAPAHRATKMRAAHRAIDRILHEGVELTTEQLHQLAQRLTSAAQQAERSAG